MTRQRLSLIEKIHRKEEPEDSKLTASIRPMTVKEQKTPQVVVVPQQNVVQPMQQQQVAVAVAGTSSSSNLTQQTISLQSGPVSQAQVSSSGSSAADFYTQQRVVSIQPHVQEQEEEGEEDEEGEEHEEEEEGEVEREDDEGEGGENIRGEVSSSLQQGQSQVGESLITHLTVTNQLNNQLISVFQHPTHPEASSSTSTKRSRSAECDEGGNVNKRGKFNEGEEQEEEEDMEEEEEQEEDQEDDQDEDDMEEERDEEDDDEEGDSRERVSDKCSLAHFWL